MEVISSTLSGQTFRWDGKEYELALLGDHQLHNAATVLNVVEAMRERGWKVPDEAVKEGLRDVRWPARLEILGRKPLFILDGGHNPQCAEALANALKSLLGGKKVVFLLGVLADKDYPHMMEMMIPYAKSFVCLTPQSNRALPASKLCKFFKDRGCRARWCAKYESGIKRAVEEAGDRGIVVAFGSLYMAGHIRTEYANIYGK